MLKYLLAIAVLFAVLVAFSSPVSARHRGNGCAGASCSGGSAACSGGTCAGCSGSGCAGQRGVLGRERRFAPLRRLFGRQ